MIKIQKKNFNLDDEIEKIKNKHSFNNIAILVRAIFQTREFEERFLKIGIPYRICLLYTSDAADD